jgi:hypothetical protein
LPTDKSADINAVGLVTLDKKNKPLTEIDWQSNKPLNFYTALPLLSEFDLINTIEQSRIKLNTIEGTDAYQHLIPAY